MAPKKRTTRTSPATTTTPTTPMTDAQIKALIDQGVAHALAERDAERSRNGDDSHDSATGGRRQVSTICECTYTDFLKCQHMNFKGTEGVVGLTQWLEKMESVFHISNCTVTCQVKFATCTLQGNALTWWNSHVRAVKGTDVMSYNQRFQELALMCDMMFLEESDIVEKYVDGLPDMILGSFEDTSRNNQNKQQPFKRNNVARVYTAGPGEKKPYGGSKTLCPKCNYHHDGQCAPKCTNCKRIGHSAYDCKSWHVAANNNQRAQGANQRVLTCFESRAHAVGTVGTNPNSNVVMGTFLLNNHLASILFDRGADRSFVSTAVGIKRLLDDLGVTAAKYIQMIDYSLWEVIENGNAPLIRKVVEGVDTTIAPTTAEERHKGDAKLLLHAVEKRFGGNAATKKTKRNLLKQQYENFTASSSEVLDQTFDRLQKLIIQLEIHGESISQEDVNQKFLINLSLEWNTHTIMWRNKSEIYTLSLDDIYNNLNIYEPEVNGTLNSSTNTQNVAFVSSNSTSSINGAVNSTANTQSTAVNSITIENLSDAVIYGFKVADGYANNEGKEILKEHWKKAYC
ncbi:hypothetical protein Tco_0382399 [Tanacetum coccineum]